MILIFGGAYQGKLAYAQERFGIDSSQIYYCDENSKAIPKDKKIIYEIDRWILALVRENEDIPIRIKELIESNEDTIIISNDISNGIVPMDVETRKWREETGIAMTTIAKESEEVIRLFCGIPTKVK